MSELSKGGLDELKRQWLSTMGARERTNERDILFGFLLGKGLRGDLAHVLAYKLDIFDMTLL